MLMLMNHEIIIILSFPSQLHRSRRSNPAIMRFLPSRLEDAVIYHLPRPEILASAEGKTKIKREGMEFDPTVALRALLAGGIAIFAKVGAVMKAAGGVKVGAATAAVSAAAAAAVSGTKQEKEAPKPK